MIGHIVRLLNKNQRGSALIELVVIIAITGIIAAGITSTIFSVFSGNVNASGRMTAVRQVQNAGYWISHDVQMAQSVAPAADPDPDGFPLTLTWTDRNGDQHQVVYTLLADNKLQREHYTNRDTNPDPDAVFFVAKFIDQSNTTSELTTDGVLIFHITVAVATGTDIQRETRVYEAISRLPSS